MSAVPARSPSSCASELEFVDLGRIDYESALAIQRAALEEVIRRRADATERDDHEAAQLAREGSERVDPDHRDPEMGHPGMGDPEAGESGRAEPGGPRGTRRWIGRIHLLEHDPPVITVTRRPGAAGHVLADGGRLAALGIERRETDRGGDVTYHGPGQLVVYPIVDLNALGLRIHGYMRLLEDVVIRTLGRFGLEGRRDPTATGVWIDREGSPAKVCAVGVRVSRWVAMHGLALNVDPDLSHFDLIVPCGLAGRPVTSIVRELVRMRDAAGTAIPSMDQVKGALREEFALAIADCRPAE